MSQVGITSNQNNQPGEWENAREDLREQLDRSRLELKEISMMLDQSQVEVNRLAQRNATTNSHLQRMQSQFDSVPREDIKAAYDSALDSQQRLFVMRGHLEKLQSDQAHLQRRVTLLEQMVNLSENVVMAPMRPKISAGTIEILETMIKAQEAERQRLSRQMHDGPAQTLSNLILQTEIAMRLFEVDKAQAYEELGHLRDSATSAFQQVRDFIFELRPMMLDDLGLVPTIKKYTSAFKDQTGIEFSLALSGIERRLEPYLEVMIFRAMQELLSNAAFHSQASQVKLSVDLSESEVQVTVVDNGRGFDTASLEKEKGMGIKLIKERVEMVGGTFELESQVGEGTRVYFKVPAGISTTNE